MSDVPGSLPLLDLTPLDERLGRIAPLQAQASRVSGPVVHARIPSGTMAGPCVCLVGRDALEFAYGEGRDCLSSALGWQPLIGRRFGCAVLNSDDPAHAEERRAWAPAFTTATMERAVAPIDALVCRRVDRWIAEGVVDAYAASRELAFAVVAVLAAGFADDEQLAELGAWFAEALAPPAGDDPAAHHFRVRPLRDAIERSLEAHVRALDASGARGLLAALLKRQPAIATSALIEHLGILLIAGHETTSTLLAWTLLLAAGEPEWRDRLAEEATQLPAGAATFDTLAGMGCADAFVAEAGRLHPPLVIVPRVAARDFVLAGVRIDAGTIVALAIGATHRLGAHADDADAFRPQRHLGAADARTARSASPLFTFGYGPRLCLGMRLAQLTVKLALARLLQRATPTRATAGECAHAGFWNARPRGALAIALTPRT
jgi:cytochrome P450